MNAAPANQRPWRLSGHWWVLPREGGRTSSTSNVSEVRFFKKNIKFNLLFRRLVTGNLVGFNHWDY